MAGTAYLTRMPLGIAGGVTRPRDLTIEPVSLDHTKQFASYGLPGKYVNDKFVPLESGDTISKVKGILVRPFPITSALDLAYIGVTADQVTCIKRRQCRRDHWAACGYWSKLWFVAHSRELNGYPGY